MRRMLLPLLGLLLVVAGGIALLAAPVREFAWFGYAANDIMLQPDVHLFAYSSVQLAGAALLGLGLLLLAFLGGRFLGRRGR